MTTTKSIGSKATTRRKFLTGATAVAVRNFVAMQAPQADPTKDIAVQALLVDNETLDEVEVYAAAGIARGLEPT